MRCLIVLLLHASLYAQQIAVGKMLVATKKSHDPDLGRSVILLVHYDARGAIGLILNRPSKVPLADVMPELKNIRTPVYAGGPVTIGVRAVCRGVKPGDATRVSNDMFLVSTKSLLANVLDQGSCRVYAGYTGWTAGQLQSELAQGLWRISSATTREVFDPSPEDLWRKLNP